MSRRLLLAVAFAAALLPAAPTAAQRGHSGHYLYTLCKSSRAVCQGYVTAVVDVMGSLAYLHGVRACIPPASARRGSPRFRSTARSCASPR